MTDREMLREAMAKVRGAASRLPSEADADYVERAVLALGSLKVRVDNAQKLSVELLQQGWSGTERKR